MKLTLLPILCLLTISAIAQPHVSLDEDKPLAVLMNTLGEHHYPITTGSPLSQKFFNQGLALTYGYYFAQARASFQEAIRLDPDCAMCYWGLALAHSPTPNSRYMGGLAGPSQDGKEAIQNAYEHKNNASEKEWSLIEALNYRFDPALYGTVEALDDVYARAMEKVVARYPEDAEIHTLYAEALMVKSPWQYWNADGKPRGDTEIARLHLERAMQIDSLNPGANHLYIHLMESSQDPELALPAADRLEALMPGAGHIVHMPSHIYIRVGQYQKAIESNMRSVEVDNVLLDTWSEGGVSTQIGHTSHAHDFLRMAANLQGNYQKALDAAQTMANMVTPAQLQSSGSRKRRYTSPWLVMNRFGQWDAILELDKPSEGLPYVSGMWHFVRGSALVAKGQMKQARKELHALESNLKIANQVKPTVMANSALDVLSIAHYVLKGEIAWGEGKHDEAVSYLETATRLEDGLRYMEPPDWDYPVRQILGAVLLDANRLNEAEAVYWEDLRRNPENGWSLYGVWQSLLKQGDTKLAAEVKARYDKAWLSEIELTSSRIR